MENKDIYQLMDRFEGSSLTHLEIEKAGSKIVMKKDINNLCHQISAPVMETSKVSKQENITEESVGNFREIKAPLVGIFYMTPSPDSEPYVKVGDRVSKGQVLCLLEAMKMMNEMKSPVDGIIRNILPQHGTPVEFDQILFEVEEC